MVDPLEALGERVRPLQGGGVRERPEQVLRLHGFVGVKVIEAVTPRGEGVKVGVG